MISAVKELGDNNTTDSFYKEAIIIFLFLLTSLIFAVLYGGEYIRKTKRAIAEKNYEDEDEVSPKKTKDTEEESEDS